MNRRLGVGMADVQLDRPRESHRHGWLGLALLYGLATVGGVHVVVHWLVPAFEFLAMVPR